MPPIANPGGFRFVPHLLSVDRQGDLYLAEPVTTNRMLHKLERVKP